MAFDTYNIYLGHSRELEKKLDSIIKTLSTMPTKQEFQDALAEVNTALDNIGDDITRLTDQIGNSGGLNEADAQEALNELRALGQRAKDLAARTPETPEEPQP
jgi:flagellar motility protein MotE (MotC chaperone)